jgi:hypothetical protein
MHFADSERSMQEKLVLDKFFAVYELALRLCWERGQMRQKAWRLTYEESLQCRLSFCELG